VARSRLSTCVELRAPVYVLFVFSNVKYLPLDIARNITLLYYQTSIYLHWDEIGIEGRGTLTNNWMTLKSAYDIQLDPHGVIWVCRSMISRPIVSDQIVEVTYLMEIANVKKAMKYGGSSMEVGLYEPFFYENTVRYGSFDASRNKHYVVSFSHEHGTGHWFGRNDVNSKVINGYRSGDVIVAKIDMKEKLFSFHKSNELIAYCNIPYSEVVLFVGLSPLKYGVQITLMDINICNY